MPLCLRQPIFRLFHYSLFNGHPASVECTSGWYEIIRLQMNMISFNDNVNLQIASIDRIAHVPSSFPRQGDQSRNSKNQSAPTTRSKKNEQDAVRDKEYVVVKITRHIGQASDMKYVVRWYGSSKEHDTLEPPGNFPQHFINRYWWIQERNKN